MKRCNFQTIVHVHDGYFPFHLENYFDIERVRWGSYTDVLAIVIKYKEAEIVVETGDLIVVKPFNRLFVFPKRTKI